MGLCFLWFYVQELPKAQPAVVLVLKRLRRRGNSLKYSSDRLGEAGNRTCDPWFTRHRFIHFLFFSGPGLYALYFQTNMYPICIKNYYVDTVYWSTIFCYGGEKVLFLCILRISSSALYLPKMYIHCEIWYMHYKLTDFNFSTVTSLYIFQKMIDCKLNLLWWRHQRFH